MLSRRRHCVPSDESVTFRWFVKERYIPMRQGKWSPAYRKTNTYQLEHYLISQFGDLPLCASSTRSAFRFG